ncbi:unnamed protein product [Allacma fusca]|uniref:Uncharacterized protein n=1 Tax=Allacma fusca TaxID=39272 RepID=A0A8J2L2K2_9HEXA|nr:unnamed protein product [Allacma fusca]
MDREAPGYPLYFGGLRKLGVFPYDYQDLTMTTKVLTTGKKFYHLNILTAFLIVSKQLYLILLSLSTFTNEGPHPDMMFRVMWFLGSLFLTSMFLVHILFPTEVARFISSYIRIENSILASTSLWTSKDHKKKFKVFLCGYFGMWVGGQVFMGALYIWNPAFFPFIYSELEYFLIEGSWTLRKLLFGTVGLFEMNFMGLAMANMAGFDILIGFASLSIQACLVELEKVGKEKLNPGNNNVFRYYKMLEILTKLMNEAFSTVLLGHFWVVFMMLPFFIYGLEHYAVSAATTLFFFWCCLFQVVRVATIWIPMAFVQKQSWITLRNLRSLHFTGTNNNNSNSALFKRQLKSCQPLAFSSGGLYSISVESILKYIYFSTTFIVIFVG